MKPWVGALAGAMICLSAGSALGEDATLGGSLGVIVENDVFFSGTDRNYTNGVKAIYAFEVDATPLLGQRVGRMMFGEEDRDILMSLSLGQSLFTPEDISTAAPLPDQHPYAGWLYLGASVASVTARAADILTLELGVVGPSAGGKAVQRSFHTLIDGEDPRGWDNQLSDEPGVLLAYDRILRLTDRQQFSGRGVSMDVTPSFGASLGNIATEARAGVAFRLGTGLTRDFGPPRIRPAPSGTGLTRPSEAFTWYLFTGVYATARAYSIFLDGNAFTDSLSVDREPFVGQIQGGLVMQWRGVELAYTLVGRSEEFETQRDPQRFGALSLSVGF